MSPEVEINQLLSNDQAIKTINGDRVFFIQAPQQEMNTYIIFNMVKEPIRTKDGIAGYNNTLLMEIYAKKNETAFQLESAVISTLEQYKGTGNQRIRKIDFVESYSEKNEETGVSYKIIKSVLTVKN